MALTSTERSRLSRQRAKFSALLVPLEEPLVEVKSVVAAVALAVPGPATVAASLPSVQSLLDGVFIDWLSIYQAHPPGTVPIVGSEFVVTSDIETGEIVSQRVTSFQHEGSFDTRLHVRCDGNVIWVSGNPSAYDRMDNLFGLRSVHDAVEVYNRVLCSLGLPEFDNSRPHESMKSGSTVRFHKLPEPVKVNGKVLHGFFTSDDGRQSAHYDSMLSDGRPRITGIHLTVNIATSDAVGFLRQMSGYVHQGKAGYLYPNGRSVDWPMAKGFENRYSRRVYHKYYDKAFELEAKLKGAIKQYKDDPLNVVLLRRVKYLQELYNWAKSHGIVRREIELKSTELIDRGLIYIESWSHEVMSNIIRPYQFHFKLKTEETRLDNVYEYLLSQGQTSAIAAKAALLHRAWVNGDDVMVLSGSRDTFYRYRKLLLGVGVDIKQPCNISRIALRVERFTWSSIEPPEWYVQPDLTGHTNKAA